MDGTEKSTAGDAAGSNSSTSLLSVLPDVLLQQVIAFLDLVSLGSLSCTAKCYKKNLDGSNPCWFSRASALAQQEGYSVSASTQTSADSVDWKKVMFMHNCRKNVHPFAFKDYLNDFVLMMAGRKVETQVCCSGTIPIKPELYVPAAGMRLSLPIDPKQLRDLIDGEYCEQAPVGRGAETVVDIGTRKCWRLMLGKDIFVGNKEWNAEMSQAGYDVSGTLHQVQERLMPRLFGSGDVFAQPYSFLIYEEGSFFKPHRDTLRGPGHFGSMIVMLPVNGGSQGGDFILTHNSASSETPKQVDRVVSPRSDEDSKYCAFYTDIFHEVQPVTSGYRVALTYHLWAVPNKSGMVTNIPRPITNADDESIDILLMAIFQRTLSDHLKGAGSEFRYVFALDHSYGSRHLSVQNLRGRDALHYSVFENDQSDGEAEVNLTNLCVETFSKPTNAAEYKQLKLISVQNEEERGTENMSEHTIWLNQERFLAMDHEFEEYQYYTGNDGYATGMQYEHACIEVKPYGLYLEYD